MSYLADRVRDYHPSRASPMTQVLPRRSFPRIRALCRRERCAGLRLLRRGDARILPGARHGSGGPEPFVILVRACSDPCFCARDSEFGKDVFWLNAASRKIHASFSSIRMSALWQCSTEVLPLGIDEEQKSLKTVEEVMVQFLGFSH